jgi:hypothetical protein
MTDLFADRWREYLTRKLQERYGVTVDVAANWTDEWLRGVCFGGCGSNERRNQEHEALQMHATEVYAGGNVTGASEQAN